MYYESELNFLRKALKKMRVQTALVRAGEMPKDWVDFGLRKFLGREDEYEKVFHETIRPAKENVIYKLTDSYHCNYSFLVLPNTNPFVVLLVGPYTSFEMNPQKAMEEAERLSVPPTHLRQFMDIYSNIPVFADVAPLFSLMNVFAEHLWGEGSAYEIVDVDRELSSVPLSQSVGVERKQEDDVLVRMKVLEARYARENELIETVSRGLLHRAERAMANFSQLNIEQRMADPVRNMKNYCIIFNTLLRKAAEKGGVHPLYLDGVSSEFAHEIETISGLSMGQDLMGRMIRSYCRLVKRHSTERYPSVIQKTITYIDADLSSDLSLTTLASMQGISASYLSTLFKKETGRTLTDYINQKRVDMAVHLLTMTKLQVQTIAQHCGISDVNYFSKIFKKYTQKTPKEYRNDSRQKS